MEYVFKSERGYCPQCIAFGKVYFIQDRYLGVDKYEYALFSRPEEKKTPIKFPNIGKMVSYIYNSDFADDKLAIENYLNYITVEQCSNARLLEKGDKKYVWDELKKELREYTEPKQETGYCNTYLECLNMAKDILKKKEIESTGIQMSLLG